MFVCREHEGREEEEGAVGGRGEGEESAEDVECVADGVEDDGDGAGATEQIERLACDVVGGELVVEEGDAVARADGRDGIGQVANLDAEGIERRQGGGGEKDLAEALTCEAVQGAQEGSPDRGLEDLGFVNEEEGAVERGDAQAVLSALREECAEELIEGGSQDGGLPGVEEVVGLVVFSLPIGSWAGGGGEDGEVVMSDDGQGGSLVEDGSCLGEDADIGGDVDESFAAAGVDGFEGDAQPGEGFAIACGQKEGVEEVIGGAAISVERGRLQVGTFFDEVRMSAAVGITSGEVGAIALEASDGAVCAARGEM